MLNIDFVGPMINFIKGSQRCGKTAYAQKGNYKNGINKFA
jgi:hypothetical protein